MSDECEPRVLGAPEARVVQTKEMKFEMPLLVCCFPSAGLVGTIAANTIIEQFKMEEMAHIRSKYIPSAAVFLEGKLKHPFRIYGKSEENLIVVTGELPIAENGLYFVSSALLDWAAGLGVKEAVILDGIPVQGIPTQRRVLFAAEEEKIAELESSKEMEILQKGVITGIAGSILAETLCRAMVGFALLTPAIAVIPDPEGAIKLLQALNKLYNLNVDTTELEKSAEEIRKKLEEMAKQVEGIRRQQPGATQARAAYEGMYG